MLFTGDVIPVPPHLATGGLLMRHVRNLDNAAVAVPGSVKRNAIWTAQFKALLLASGMLPQFTALGNSAITAASPAQPLFLVFHSLEHGRWRPADMTPASPQRHWQTPMMPVLAATLASEFTEGTMNTVAAHIFQIAFYVSKAVVITAMPGGGLEAGAMVGVTQDELDIVQ